MPIETVHFVMGVLFIGIWALAGVLAVRDHYLSELRRGVHEQRRQTNCR